MTSAITNPMHLEEMTGVMGADVLMGHDANCIRWIRKFREPAPDGADAACPILALEIALQNKTAVARQHHAVQVPCALVRDQLVQPRFQIRDEACIHE